MAFFRPAVSSICPCSDTCEIHGREWLYSKGPEYRKYIFCSTFSYGRVCVSRVCLGKHSVLSTKKTLPHHCVCSSAACKGRSQTAF